MKGNNMNVLNLRNSIDSAVSDNINGRISKETLVDSIISMLIVEGWDANHARVDYDELTDTEVRMISEWLILNRFSYGHSQIALVRDLRDVFPGLSLRAAMWLVRGK